jgi:hypothetical protein
VVRVNDRMLAAAGKVRTIDILTAPDDVVTDVFVVADELGRLSQLGAVTLVPTSSE